MTRKEHKMTRAKRATKPKRTHRLVTCFKTQLETQPNTEAPTQHNCNTES